MSIINVFRYDTQADDGYVKSLFIDVGSLRILIAKSQSAWYTEGKPRKIPIWWNNRGLFVYKWAIKIGIRNKEGE